VAAGLQVTAVHVDHGLRPDSAGEAAVVERLAQLCGAAFRAEQAMVGDGPNLEARARAARYGVLPPDVLTGHTADDQAETVLVNLMRGAALPGLAAMRPGPRRPLLAVRRQETNELCAALGLQVIDDPTNRDPRHLRNRVRHELLPLLDALAGRDLVPVLTRQADLVRGDDDLLDALASALDPTNARELAAAPLPLARRAVRRWLATTHPPDRAATHPPDRATTHPPDRATTHPPDLAAVDRVLAVARGERKAAEVAGGRRVSRHRQRLVVSSDTAQPRPPARTQPGDQALRAGPDGAASE
jgi:tRNA(Ile)-lysidine synthase